MPAATRAQDLLSSEFLTQLERLALVSRKAFRGRTRGERKSPRKGMSVEFADYRAYGAGDDLRYVDWNIYGRLDRLYLKLFVDEEDLYLHLLLDGSASPASSGSEWPWYAIGWRRAGVPRAGEGISSRFSSSRRGSGRADLRDSAKVWRTMPCAPV